MTDSPNGIHDSENGKNDSDNPKLIPSRPGRMVSFRGLIERIIEEFDLEHGEGLSDVLRQSTTDVERRKLVRDIASYIFGVESVQLSPQEQAEIIRSANSEIFGYGALDDLLHDEMITTITLEGVSKVGVRYGVAQELELIDSLFEDTPQMRRLIQRLLRHAGAELQEDTPIIETGLTIGNRKVSLSVVAPPLAPEMAVDIRLHPATLSTLDDWLEVGFINEKSKELLEAIAQSEHGFMIIGDTESGKTTLLSMLLQLIDTNNMITVERAGELTLPENAERFITQWGYNDNPQVTFGEQIKNALNQDADVIVLDEVRADEPRSIAPLLANETVPRQIWSFRGASEAKRVASALGMLARMADDTKSESLVINNYRRLPFMIIIKRRKGQLQVREIAEWQFPEDSSSDEITYADYVPLMQMGWEGCELSGKRPQRDLGLPDGFWEMDD